MPKSENRILTSSVSQAEYFDYYIISHTKVCEQT